MPDWTIIATTLGAASITGALGYGTARLQSKATIKQIEGETMRQHLGHAEEHRRALQQAYLDVMEIVDRHYMLLAGTNQEDFDEWRKEYGRRLDTATLLGSPEVRDATDELWEVFFELGELAMETAGERPWIERMREASPHVEGAMQKQAVVLVDAMRKDISRRWDDALVAQESETRGWLSRWRSRRAGSPPPD
jgi:hypothetical protein